MSAQPLILPFSQIRKDDTDLVGGKCANLGEMISAGLPVPNGFAVTIHAYDLFLKENKIDKEIMDILDAVDFNDNNELEKASKIIRKKINQAEIPEVVVKEVISYYHKLSGVLKKALVAVRSSATAEDMPGTSFAGQQITYLNVKGESNVLTNMRECWASLFTPRSIFYRHMNHIANEKVKISVAVQKMVESEVSGVMFSIDPVTNDKDRIVIESAWGLGEMIVQGSVIPDRYVVQKETFDILSKEISDQSVQLIKVGAENKETKVPARLMSVQKITDREIVELAKLADKLQKHYFYPQDSEWARENGKLYLIQTRPITTIEAGERVRQRESDLNSLKLRGARIANQADITKDENMVMAQMPILTGSPASPGIGTGEVKLLKSPKEIGKVKDGDVLVTVMTSPDYVPAMKKAAAIVTDEGGATSHAAIVSRELGIPCVVGTREATSKLRDGMMVTVNGSTGEVFLGGTVKETKKIKKEAEEEEFKGRTATHVYVNLGEPERAREIAEMNVDGVGLLRAEFMIAGIGIHPKEAIKNKTQGAFIDKLARDLTIFCKAFNPRPVIYRATDFKTNEYRALPGGKTWEPEEPNPLLGFRGALRYITNPEVFNLELSAITKVRENYNNLHLMIPFVRSPEELAKVRKLVVTAGLFETGSFKFLMMTELPVNVICLDDFIDVGIDGVSIGSNDLTMLLLGTDRDNSEVAKEFNERAPAVSWALKKIVTTCKKRGITSSICGQAASVYDDLVSDLVSWGITSISVNPDSINRVRKKVYEAEKKVAWRK